MNYLALEDKLFGPKTAFKLFQDDFKIFTGSGSYFGYIKLKNKDKIKKIDFIHIFR